MIDDLFPKFHSDQDQQPCNKPLLTNHQLIQTTQVPQRQIFLDPPRQLPKRSYSLQPDMANGWKPKRSCKFNPNSVFSLNYDQYAVDELVKELYKSKRKHQQTLAYLGPRRNNSFIIHQGNQYPNPYPPDRHLDQHFSARNGLPLNAKAQQCLLNFDSDFEAGNLDAVIRKSSNQFDLFMRVDSNTRGHNNWFYFSISNRDFVGKITLNICNFRREKSLYQRGLRPYIRGKGQEEWQQGGTQVKYDKTRLRYTFLDEEEGEQVYELLSACFTMSFSYDFATTHDCVYFAYCIPYNYSTLLKHVHALPHSKQIQPLKSLSGLDIPVLQITDEEVAEYNKKVILVTGRIHPGESNSSFVAEGLLEFVTSADPTAKELRRSFIFYVIPMLNPDGVVAGNYRTSFFGKDLNRTFDQARKFAFPQTFHLVQLARDLKRKHKKRFCLYIDLHGHSVKKNVFMYGPDFGIQHANYQASRELPRLFSGITSAFRYYSCIFRIASQKAATGRAVFNRILDVPFTYTLQSSNGFYYDSNARSQLPFTAKKWKQMGVCLCKAIVQLKLDQKLRRERIPEPVLQPQQEKNSDDEISQGKSDSEPQDQDLSQKELLEMQCKISGKQSSPQTIKLESPSKDKLQKTNSKEISRQSIRKDKPNVFLPPINTLNRAAIFSNRHRKKESFKQERLRNIESQLEQLIVQRPAKPRLTLSQLIAQKTKETPKSASFHFKKEEPVRFRISK